MTPEQVTTLSVILEPRNEKSYSASQVNSFGPLLQGALMEMCNGAYASYLHGLSFNPYSQACTLNSKKQIVWTVSTLNSEAKKYLIEPLLNANEVTLRALDNTFAFGQRSMNTLPLQSVIDKLKTSNEECLKVCFLSPTAFKRQGEYVFMPTPRLMFQNLFMHYNQTYANGCEVDPDTIEYIAQNVHISSYNLRSRYFACSAGKRTKIPAFVGEATLHVGGKQPLRGLVSMLVAFGEFAGIGIKTSMGMGMMRCSLPQTEQRERSFLG